MEYKFKQSRFGDVVVFKGKELSKEELLNILNSKKTDFKSNKKNILGKANQFVDENNYSIKSSKNKESLMYYQGINTGMDRIIKLIERNT